MSPQAPRDKPTATATPLSHSPSAVPDACGMTSGSCAASAAHSSATSVLSAPHFKWQVHPDPWRSPFLVYVLVHSTYL